MGGPGIADAALDAALSKATRNDSHRAGSSRDGRATRPRGWRRNGRSHQASISVRASHRSVLCAGRAWHTSARNSDRRPAPRGRATPGAARPIHSPYSALASSRIFACGRLPRTMVNRSRLVTIRRSVMVHPHRGCTAASRACTDPIPCADPILLSNSALCKNGCNTGAAANFCIAPGLQFQSCTFGAPSLIGWLPTRPSSSSLSVPALGRS